MSQVFSIYLYIHSVNKYLPGTWDRMVSEIYLVNVSIQFKGNDAHSNIIHIIAKKMEIIGVKYTMAHP